MDVWEGVERSLAVTARPDVEELMNFIEEVRYPVFRSLEAAGHPVQYEDQSKNGWDRS